MITSKLEQPRSVQCETLIENLIEEVSQLFLTKEQLARILNISPRTVTGWRYLYKDFPARKMGRHVRFSLPEVLDWFENFKQTIGGQHRE